ncbi:MAG: alpha/beta hydrolase [Ruminiclostridium sp.]
MSNKANKSGRLKWGLIYTGAFILTFAVSAIIRMTYDPTHGKYTVDWNDTVGTKYTDISYGSGEANKFDLYVPADKTKDSYGLVVYIHAGGFTTGDKSEDASMLQWLCSKGYVAAGINYTLFSEENPEASVYSQSMEIKSAMPYVVEEAKKLGYNVDRMAVSGGSAGGCLALIYGLRDADTSPVPVKMIFEAVGPASFCHEDWTNYGLDQSAEAAAGLFSTMAGTEITADMIENHTYDELVKPISADKWVTENSAPVVCAYGEQDKIAPFLSSKRFVEQLEKYNVPHEYFVLPHSGHGMQNDSKIAMQYMDKVVEYLEKYMG